MLHKIILDTDIGDDIDDAIALALGVKCPELDVKGVVTTYRNSVMRSKIAKAILEELGKETVPVVQGLDDPIKQPYYYFPYEKIEENGKPIIGHFEEYMEKYECSEKDGIEFMAETIRQNPYEISLVCIGPLTDIAALIKKYPDDYEKVKEVIIMGGRIGEKRPEWNIKCDPEAAEIVLSSEKNIKLVPLDVTLKCVFDQEQVNRLYNDTYNTRLSKMIQTWLNNTKHKSLPILHDPLALSCVFADFCEFEEMKIRVGLTDSERGCTLTDDEKGKSVSVATKVDNIGFANYVCDGLCR